MTMNDEEFVLQEREGTRHHSTLRLSILCATALTVAMTFNAQSCFLADQEKVKQDADLERRLLAHYTECLKKRSRQECNRAYYPDRRDPLTPQQRAALEAARFEQARQLYVHCTENTSVTDSHCDREIVGIMESTRTER